MTKKAMRNKERKNNDERNEKKAEDGQNMGKSIR
jgi:hypothetical protein